VKTGDRRVKAAVSVCEVIGSVTPSGYRRNWSLDHVLGGWRRVS